MKRIVFSDVDGTLLDSGHRIGSYTARAIAGLRERGVPFVIVSARGPSGIYPIFHRYGFRAPIISYSGALVLDEEGRMLFHRGMPKDKAGEISDAADEFSDGAQDLEGGVNSLQEGVEGLQSGAESLKEGIDSYADGA